MISLNTNSKPNAFFKPVMRCSAALIIFFIVSSAAASSRELDLLKAMSRKLESWEVIYVRDYSIKEVTGPIEKATKKYTDVVANTVVPYRDLVRAASRTFDVPPSILAGLIFQESSGRADAVPIGKNGEKLSSAQGLTQILDSTFREIRGDLNKDGKIVIGNDRSDPETAIMAGAYYLSKQFGLSAKDCPELSFDRKNNEDWCTALKYYYRGRTAVNGKRIVLKIQYQDGSTTVNPDVYCQRILRHAAILKKDYGYTAREGLK